MKKILGYFLITITSILLWRCASQTTPTGGPKDEDPPILKESIPLHKQTNFKNNTIELTFNELVKLSNPKEEIIINPTPDKDIQYIAKQNRIIIQSKNGWKDSTTYSISFREGVQDLNEGNPADELYLAFSTGTTIDSLSILGKITQALTEKIPEKITVAIYQQDTFDIFQHIPPYFTKTNKTGFFKIENLKPGQYFVYAFDDKNKNLKVDSRNEKFGFLAEPIELLTNTDTLSISIYQIDSRLPAINSIRNTGTITKLSLNKNLVSYAINNPDKAKIYHSFGESQSEINIYNQLPIGDSVKIQMQGIDSLDLRVDSTFFIKRIETKLPPEKFTFKPLSSVFYPETSAVLFKLQVNKPISLITYDSIYLTTDDPKQLIPVIPVKINNDKDSKRSSLKTKEKPDTTVEKKKSIRKIKVEQNSITIDSAKNIISISTILERKSITDSTRQISLVLEPTFLLTIEGDTSKREINTITLVDAASSGTLLVEVATMQKHYEIQLLTIDGKLLQKVRNIKKHAFNYLPAQEYKIMVYSDLNNNGIWDPQNIYLRKSSEPIYFYKTDEGKYSFPIRASWELGPLILKF